MGIENEFHELCAAFAELREHFDALQVTVLEDKPLKGSVLLVDQVGYAILDLRGLVEESIAALAEADDAVRDPKGGRRARPALALCHERFIEMDRRFNSDMLSYDRISDLNRFGRERRGEWLGWTRSVREAMETCRGPLERVKRGLMRCWEALAGRAGPGLVAVQTTNIGLTPKAPTAN